MINYGELPDDLSKEYLETLFIDMLNFIESDQALEQIDFIIDGLWELSNRQWHTYEILNESIKIRIDSFLRDNINKGVWRSHPILFLNKLLGIIGNLGLSNSYISIKEMEINNVPEKYVDKIRKFIMEVDYHKKGQIENPYSML